MAIQNRRGAFADFDPTKMVAGEFAVVQTGDPNADDGKAVYVAFSAGSVKRLATYEDIEQSIWDAAANVIQDIEESIEESVAEDVATAQQAAEQAQQAAETLTIDNTLTHTGQAADAKTVGDKLADVKEDLNDKVDKVIGKGLSTNDYTNEDKQKVTDTLADVSAIKTATDNDVGKALMIKTVTDGEVTEWEFGKTSSVDIGLATSVTQITEWTVGFYHNISGATATVDINNPTSDSNYKTAVIQCDYGDCFIINSTGGENQRAWAFLDENYTIILNANPLTNYVNAVIRANYGAKYLIINKLLTDSDCYIGRTVPDEFTEQNSKIDAIDGLVDSLYGVYYDPYTNCYDGKYGNGLLNDNGIIIKSVQSGNQKNCTTDFLKVEGNTTYVFSYDNNGVRQLAQIPVICQYDAGKRFISNATAKTTILTDSNCKYIRLSVAKNHEIRLNSDFMVSKGTSAPAVYVPYTYKNKRFGSIKNILFSTMRGERTVSNANNLISSSFGDASAGHICFGTISIKSEYEISSVSLKMSEITIRFTSITTNAWNKLAGVGYSKAGASKTTFNIQVYFADEQSHPFTYKEALGFDETAVFGAGNELSADALMKKLTEKSYAHEYFTLMTDLGASSPAGRVVSARKSKHSEIEPYFGFDEENSPIISSEPYSGWSGWNDIGTYGQSQVTQIPIYNKVHGTLETDGMFSAIPQWGCWSQNASGSNSHHGGHVFHGWTTDRQHRLTMAVNIYRDDEAAIFNYVPADRAEGAISGEGRFLRLRLGADNSSHGVLLDNVYRESGGYYTRMQVKGMLNVQTDSREAPASSSADGVAGDICFDSNYVYFCVADNSWKRIPMQSW